MFGTLHYNAHSNETQFVERSTGGAEQGGDAIGAIAHFACDSCRMKKLKCDGQKKGCFRCKASSAPCSYTKYSSKKEIQRKHGAHQRPGSGKKTLSHDLTSPSHQDSIERGTRPEGVYKSIDHTSDVMHDAQISQHENTPSELISSPNGLGGLRAGDEPWLLDDFLPGPMPDNNLQGEDASALDFSHFSAGGTIYETISESIPDQLPSPDLTSSSPRFYPPMPTVSSTSASTPQLPFDNDRTSPHAAYPPAKAITFPTSEFEASTHTSARTVCHCPQAMSTLLEDSENRSDRISIQTMHFALAHVKTALQHCAQSLDCTHCSSRSDHMMLATVVVKKLVSILEEAVGAYKQRRASSPTYVGRQQCSDTNSRHHHHHQNKNSWYDLFIGDYAINSEVEWAAVMRALLAILSKRTLDLVERMKEVARLKEYETQVQMICGAEQRARKVVGSMRDGTWSGGGGYMVITLPL